jgi:hypothetical protein
MKQLITIICIATMGASLCNAQDDSPPRTRALVVVDSSVHPHISQRLETYVRHIRREFDTELKVLVDNFYGMKPPAIRRILKTEYDRSPVPLIGAIMVGPIPHALRSGLGAVELTQTHEQLFEAAKARGDGRAAWRHWVKMPMLCPAPLYYEDFDAIWIDEDDDGVFERFETDAENNPTEIWTAWWVPPANDPESQIMMLNSFLKKLDVYHRGSMDGRNGMIFIAGNGNSVEITEAWTVLMRESMESTGQTVAQVISRHAEMAERVHPRRSEEFFEDELIRPLTGHRWQHMHILTHGNPAGYYWDGRAVTVDTLNTLRFRGTGANIITTSGCSNGNFRGKNKGTPDYTKSMGNILIFSNSTATVAYYGAASPQSTGVFAVIHTELIEALDPATGGCIGEGYYNLRNADYCWGTTHYFFRCVDGKVLSGDPFARYH